MRIPERARKLVTDPTRAWRVISTQQQAIALALDAFTDPVAPRAADHVRFVCISDTHDASLDELVVPDADVLIHAGDFSQTGRIDEVRRFAAWLGSLPHARKLVIAGNHDLTFDEEAYPALHKRFGHAEMYDTAACRAILEDVPRVECAPRPPPRGPCARMASCGAVGARRYLSDSGTRVGGLNVWGSPWQPEFCGWAFNLRRGAACRAKWRLIPDDTHVVVTHGPALGHGDLCDSGQRAGCLDLLDAMQTRVRPLVHVSGHIHEGYGVTTDGHTLYVNASTCDLQYRPIHAPIVFDLPADPPRADSNIASTLQV